MYENLYSFINNWKKNFKKWNHGAIPKIIVFESFRAIYANFNKKFLAKSKILPIEYKKVFVGFMVGTNEKRGDRI